MRPKRYPYSGKKESTFVKVDPELVENQKGEFMEAFIISVLTSLIVTYTMMHYHIYKVNELYKKYMDFETSSVKKFAEDIISKLPKNSSLGE